jgi:hypothetical protein
MNFIEAVKSLKKGKVIRRKSQSYEYFKIVNSGRLQLLVDHLSSDNGIGEPRCWISKSDITAKDWEIKEEIKK